MLCFRDMTFCSAMERCATTNCFRRFDDAQKAAADKWWGKEGAPVAFSDFSPSCSAFVEIKATSLRSAEEG